MSVADLVPRQRGATALLLLVITAFACVLRLRGLGSDSLWLDEGVTWAQTRNGVVDAIVQTSRDTYPPGYNFFTAIVVSLLGEAEWVLRLPAAIFGTLAVPAAYWLGRLSAGRLTGFVAALLVALSATAIYYSQEARMYSLLMVSATLTTAAAMAYVARPSLGRGVAVAASGALLLYSHPYGALSWASLGGMSFILLVLQRAGARNTGGCIASFGAAFVLFLPWLFVTLGVAEKLGDNGFWIPRPNWWTPFEALAQLSGTWLQFLFVIAGCLLSLIYWLRRPKPAQRDESVVSKSIAAPILLASFFGPLVAGLAISLTLTPVFISRYLICCLPALLVFVAIGYSQLAAINRTSLVAACTALTVWLVLAAASDDPTRWGHDTRALGVELNYAMGPNDCLMVIDPWSRVTVGYYLDRVPQCDLTGSDAASLPTMLPKQARAFLVLIGASTESVEAVQEALGGSWSADRYFGGAIRLTVREPT